MDPEQLAQVPNAPYPAPPPFWKHFTSTNVALINDAEPDADLPYELNFLRPPPPPTEDTEAYTTFSTPWKLDPTPALPPPDILLVDHTSPRFNHAKALKQLTNSLLLNFLELITVLSNDPVKHQEKLQDIERLMLNVNFVVNLYRPHQAREGVKEMLQDQLEDGRREIERCEELKKRTEAFLSEVQQQSNDTAVSEKKDVNGQHDEENKKLWALIHSLKDD